jgi:hypothetical protein
MMRQPRRFAAAAILCLLAAPLLAVEAAQAISEILPDGDKEKQLMQGLLASRDRLADLAREQKLF